MSDAPQDPLDRAVLAELRSILSDEGVAELIDLYRQEAPHMHAALDEAIASRETARVRSAAHRLKGAASGIGARAVEHAARRVEHEAHAGRLPDVATLAELRDAAAKTEAALRAWPT